MSNGVLKYPKTAMMTTEAVAEYLGVSIKTVLKFKKKGLLPALRGSKNPLYFSTNLVVRYANGEDVAPSKRRGYYKDLI